MQKTGGKSDISAEIKRSNSRLEELNQELEEIRTFQLMTSDGSASLMTSARQPGCCAVYTQPTFRFTRIIVTGIRSLWSPRIYSQC